MELGTHTKIRTIRRDWSEPRELAGLIGQIKPRLCLDEDREPTGKLRGELAYGLIVGDRLFELPDNPDGDYHIVLELITNFYGYYEGGGSHLHLVRDEKLQQFIGQFGAGIINEIGWVSIRGGQVVEEDRTKSELYRCQHG